jgi:hypothetical protein
MFPHGTYLVQEGKEGESHITKRHIHVHFPPNSTLMNCSPFSQGGWGTNQFARSTGILTNASHIAKKSVTLDEMVNFFLYSFIHMCIHCLGHFSPILLTPSLSPHPTPSFPGRTCSALISNFVEEKT